MQIRGMWSAGPGDEQARFLADLRALRDVAAIGYDELAARAHYPSDVLKEAENGPLLPGLPVLSAYVRACEGDVLDWEERWRRLSSEVPEDPGLPVRPAGASPAAVAGARAGVGVAPPDVYDPERIMAALRGGHERSGQGGRRNSDQGISVPTRGAEFSDRSSSGWGEDTSQDTGGRQDAGPNLDTGGASLAASAGWSTDPSWDAGADQTITMTNGNHSAKRESRGPFDAAVAELPDHAQHAEQPDEFRWLPETEPVSRPAATEFAWSDQADTGQAAEPADSDATLAEPAASEWTPRRQDDVLTPPEREDFWSTPTPPAAADLQLPTAPPRRAEEQKLMQAFSAPDTMGISAAPATSTLSKQPVTDPVPSAGFATAAQPRTSAGPTGSATPQTSSTEPARHQKDRFFPARLLVIIVIAALIGSALVLLLR